METAMPAGAEPGAPTLHGLLAEFSHPDHLLGAAKRARAAGFRAMDAFTPFPVEGLAEVLEFNDRKVQGTMLLGGITGALVGFGMQVYATVLHYPLNVGGRPLFSWPAYIVITFELTVLFAGLSGLAAIIIYNGLTRLNHPLFEVPAFARATRDRFFLLIEAGDANFRPRETREFLRGLGSLEVTDVEA